MRLFIKFLIAFGLFFYGSAAVASQWQIDPDHTEIRFQVNHILTSVSGQFSEFKGDIFFDPKYPETGKFNFTVQVKSVDTNNGKRDNHLRSKDFFNSDKYPEMKFKSSKISYLRDSVYILEGMMTIKDVTKKIKMEFEFLKPQPHPFVKKKNVGGFKTHFIISRLDYHVGNGKFVKMGVVGPDVFVEIAMEALTDK